LIGLTRYTIFSRHDFEFLGTFLFASLSLLIIWGVILRLGFVFFEYSPGLEIGYSVIGSLIFCGYIIYDTHMIMNKLGIDDFIIASIELYLDLINLFLMVLRTLAASKR